MKTLGHMNTEEASQYLNVPIGTLAYWRHLGEGPAYFKLGRRVLYRPSDLDAFCEASASNTGEGNDA